MVIFKNDAQQFASMDQLKTDLEFPDNCYLLGKIYPNRGNVVTQFTAQQIARKPGNQRRKCLKFNRFVQRYRIGVEHAIAELKTYKSVGSAPIFIFGKMYMCRNSLQKKELGLIL